MTREILLPRSRHAGRTTGTSIAFGQTLSPGSPYYWRVDQIGFSATNQGPIWSFTLATITINPAQIMAGGIVGYNPASMALSATGVTAAPWSAAVTGNGWLGLSSTSGTTPSSITISFNTAALAIGTYTNNIEFTAGGLKIEVPVTVNIGALNITKMTADRVRPYIYALQPPALSGQNGTLLFINTLTGNIDKSLPIGINPTDLTINYGEGRLYIASWTEAATYVVDLNAQTLLPSLNLGTDIYKINAGRAGRIVTEGEDQWIGVNLVDTVGGTNVGSFPYPEREGDGEADPAGNFYYHCDNNISDAYIHKFVMTNDTPVQIAGSDQHPYGTRNLVLSADGSRLFWNSYEFDANLDDLGPVGTEVYCCNSNGSVAFGSGTAVDGNLRTVIYNLPVSSTVSVVDGQNQNFWFYNSGNGTLGSVPMKVVESPSITLQPASNTGVLVGNPVYLLVTAMGLGPLSYQWEFSGTNLPGATNYFLSLTSVQPSQQGGYQVVVANSAGTITSTVANVTVLMAPSITNQSASTSVLAGQPLNLWVAASGTAPVSYGWYFQNAVISGATSSNLMISNAQQTNEGIYQVVVTNSVGAATSAVMFVRVDPAGPTIVSNPSSLTLPASSNATFAVTAVGSQTLSYQWYFNAAPIAGATAAQLTLSGVQSGNAGSYYVIVSNAIGTATSKAATLAVTPMAPYFVIQPVGAAVTGGSSHTFSGLANGSQPISYQWLHSNTNIPGANSTSLALVNISINDAGSYALVASNAASVTSSTVAQLKVYQVPTLMGPLTNQVVDAGSNVVLSANVQGTPTLGYFWRLNGLLIGGSNSILSLTNIQPAQSGFYSFTVTNAYGSVSATGRVSVLAPISTITAWGDNSGGQLNVPASLANVVAVAGGYLHSMALLSNQTVVVWGDDTFGQTNVPAGLTNVVAIAAGDFHNFALLSSGRIVSWGDDLYGQTNVPVTVTNAIGVASGNYHGLALIPSAGMLLFTNSPSGLALSWINGSKLQWASLPTGPYYDVPVNGCGYTNTDWTAPMKFFRLRR
jgi:hypothetical protein